MFQQCSFKKSHFIRRYAKMHVLTDNYLPAVTTDRHYDGIITQTVAQARCPYKTYGQCSPQNQQQQCIE